MNILYLCDEYPPGRHGGIGTAVQLLARAMAKLGHRVVVAGFYDWGYGGRDAFEDEGVKVYRFRRGLDSSWFTKKDSIRVRATYKLLFHTGILHCDIKRSLKKYAAFINGIIVEHAIDIIEKPDFNEYIQYCKTDIPFPAFKVPTVVKLHGSISFFTYEAGHNPSVLIKQADLAILRQADALSSVSNYVAEKTAEYMQFHKPVKVLYNGVDTHLGSPIVKQDGLVVFTGSLVEKKGIYQLMKAWDLVIEKQKNAKLLVIGKGNTKRAADLLTKAAAASVSFLGHISREDLLVYLKKASVAIFPSFSETFGLAAVEAMAAGTATIFTTRTTGPEIIDDGVNGLLADPADVNSIAEKLLFLLQNAAENKRIAAAGVLKAARFDVDRVAKEHEAFYRSVIGA
jgi:glycosyltransferase involved in cell wall biosynthesis